MKMKLCLSTILAAGALATGASAQTGYVPFAGTYYGLFYETNGVWQQSSGTLTITTRRKARIARG